MRRTGKMADARLMRNRKGDASLGVTRSYERSFQLSAWMMLPSLYDQVIFS
jgi:hypothetical protein